MVTCPICIKLFWSLVCHHRDEYKVNVFFPIKLTHYVKSVYLTFLSQIDCLYAIILSTYMASTYILVTAAFEAIIFGKRPQQSRKKWVKQSICTRHKGGLQRRYVKFELGLASALMWISWPNYWKSRFWENFITPYRQSYYHVDAIILLHIGNHFTTRPLLCIRMTNRWANFTNILVIMT